MSEMVERVARAILAEDTAREPVIPISYDDALALARAAIAAMREPTVRGMLERCSCIDCGSTRIAYDLTEEAGAEVS